jgi:uncharacterized membrane protein SpoIIM required for sporulation
MVLERMVSVRTALKNPLWVFGIGAIVSLACLVVAYFVSTTSVGFFTSFLITITMVPLMLNLARQQEAKQEEFIHRHFSLLRANRALIIVYAAFFCGMIFSLSLLYYALPDMYVQKLFDDQITQINMIRGNVAFGGVFTKIILNNISVMFISFFFSFLFGAGAVFILAWNASILSAAIGMAAKSIGGVKGLPLAVLMFFPHGSLEILAYFIGAIAGSLVSVAVTRRKSHNLGFVVAESLQLLGVSIVLLLIAGFIESMSIIG